MELHSKATRTFQPREAPYIIGQVYIHSQEACGPKFEESRESKGVRDNK